MAKTVTPIRVKTRRRAPLMMKDSQEKTRVPWARNWAGCSPPVIQTSWEAEASSAALFGKTERLAPRSIHPTKLANQGVAARLVLVGSRLVARKMAPFALPWVA